VKLFTKEILAPYPLLKYFDTVKIMEYDTVKIISIGKILYSVSYIKVIVL
jgi:hypothetical protein